LEVATLDLARILFTSWQGRLRETKSRRWRTISRLRSRRATPQTRRPQLLDACGYHLFKLFSFMCSQ
jgi:hypothetical protein